MTDTNQSSDFKGFYLSKELIQALDQIHYTNPTPVQATSIPLILSGIDLIVQSQTGTGKTAAFGIPVIDMLEPEPGRIEVLVLAPTRELAKQVSEEFSRLSAYRPIESCSVYGGAAYGPQIKALETAQIVCATPGRLIDLLKQGALTLEHLRFFILDEADEMLSMGFERELNEVISYLPEARQSLLFSATVTDDVKALARNMLFYPEFLGFSSDSVVNTDVTHTYYNIEGVGRMRDLLRVLEAEEPDNAIIFANTKSDTFMVTKFLKRHGMRAEVLNGDLAQAERERTLAKLRTGSIDYLIATDVAARGIDISDLTHVINYVLPDSPEVYVHRTGRTGRAGNKGHAISLVSPAERVSFIQIEKQTDVELHQVQFPSTRDVVRAKQGRALERFSKKLAAFDGVSHGAQLGMARLLLSNTSDEDARVELFAKLLAIADGVISGKLTAQAPAKDEPEAVETQATSSTSEVAKEEVVAPATKPEPKAAIKPADEPAPAKEKDEEDAPVEAKVEEPPAKEEEAPREERRGRSRGRGRGRARARSKDNEDTQARVDDAAAPTRNEAKEEREERDSKPSDDRGGRRRGGARRRGGRGRDEQRSERTQQAPASKPAPKPAPVEHEWTKLWISSGRDVFKSNDEIMHFVLFNSGMEAEDFRDVLVDRRHSFVEVRRDYYHDVMASLDGFEFENGDVLSVRPARSK